MGEGVRVLGPLLRLLLLCASVVVVYGLCCGAARVVGAILHARTPLWRAMWPWALFQAYIAVGLFVWGGLPASAGGFLRLTLLMGVLSLAVAFARRRPAAWPVAAALLPWAAVWAAALVWSVL